MDGHLDGARPRDFLLFWTPLINCSVLSGPEMRNSHWSRFCPQHACKCKCNQRDIHSPVENPNRQKAERAKENGHMIPAHTARGFFKIYKRPQIRKQILLGGQVVRACRASRFGDPAMRSLSLHESNFPFSAHLQDRTACETIPIYNLSV